MDHGPARVLIVDDEEEVRSSLRKALAQENLHVDEAGSGAEALETLEHTPYDLVLADIRLGDVSGLELLVRVKARRPDVVVVLLTGYASVETAVRALREGAHDYLIKPVSVSEVRAAVRDGLDARREALRHQALLAALRAGILELSSDQGETAPPRSPESKATTQEEPRWLRVGSLVVDRVRRAVTVAGSPVALTPIELRLLLCLLDQRERVISYQELVWEVYGHTCSPAEAKQLIMPHVSNLKHKLRTRPDSPEWIENVRGVGYVLTEGGTGTATGDQGGKPLR